MWFRKLFPSKEMREYRKMCRKHRRELVKLAKETADWDWIFLHRMVLMRIRHMYEYYVSNNNVWQAEESRSKTIEQLNHVLEISRQIDDMDHEDYELPKGREREFIIERQNKEQSLYEEMYGLIGKYLRWWWD